MIAAVTQIGGVGHKPKCAVLVSSPQKRTSAQRCEKVLMETDFEIQIDDDAKVILRRQLAEHGVERSYVVIRRIGPIGDVTRGPDGSVKWSISHPHSWLVELAAEEIGGKWENRGKEKFLVVDGIPVLPEALWRSRARGVHICVRGGRLFTEPLYE